MSSISAKRNYPDNYGKNKLEIENIVRNSGLNYTIIRPSIIYGKGSKSFDFIINYLKKIPFFTPIIGNGKYKIIPVYVKDVAKVIKKCKENKKTDKKEYDIVGDKSLFFIELIDLLKKEINIKKTNIHIPLFLCNIISIIFPKIISKENIKNLTEDSQADISLAQKEINYKPSNFKENIKNGLI